MSDDPALQRKKEKVREALIERHGNACSWCGEPGGSEDQTRLTVDRLVPGSKGGTYILSNCQLLCRSCNSQKGDRTEDKTVRFASSLMQGGFTMVPNCILLSEDLSLVAKGLYSLLVYYARADEATWAGQETLYRKLGCSERRLRDAIRELEGAGLLRSRRRGLGLTNVYVLLDRVPVPPSSAPTEVADRHAAPLPIDDEEAEEEEAGKTPPTPPRGEVEQVWATYVDLMQPRRKDIDAEGRQIIRAALQVATVNECQGAIAGCRSSSFHMGQNDRGKKYNALGQILKSKRGGRTTREQIDFFLDLADKSGASTGSQSGVTSVDPATVRQAKRDVLDAWEFPGDPTVVKRGKESEEWLVEQGWRVEREAEGGQPTFVPPS